MREDGVYTSEYCQDIAFLLRNPGSTKLISRDQMVAAMPGDARSSAATSVVRGRKQRLDNVTSLEIHDTFSHAQADILKHLHRCKSDIPAAWSKICDPECDACLRAKATRLHSNRTHTCTKPGEIVSMDLWSTRTPCIVGGESMLFGALDNYSNNGDLSKLSYKTQVPDAISYLR